MSEGGDPYTDPETGILRNRIGARTQAGLDHAEAGLSVHRLVELAERYSVRPSGDLEELRGIHRHLFQDLYEWAGVTRSVDIRKPGGEPFLPASRIEVGAGFVFDELRADNHFRGMSRPQFIERLAHHYDGLNYAHRFREGNGRTQRVFWSRVARDAGWQLDWRGVLGGAQQRGLPFGDGAVRFTAAARDVRGDHHVGARAWGSGGRTGCP